MKRFFLVLALSLPSVSHAEDVRVPAEETIGFPLRVGLIGGWHFTSEDFDVLGTRAPDLVPRAGPTFGLRLGWRVMPTFGLEAEAGVVLAPTDGDEAGTRLWPAKVEVAWRPAEGHWPFTPVLTAGAGFIIQRGGAAGYDSDLLLSAGLGVEVTLNALLGLRAMAAVHATDGIDASLSTSPVLTLGLDFKAWRHRARRGPGPEPEPLRLSEPPTLPVRPPVAAGCPAGIAPERCLDTDGDGLIDAFDRCPVTAGDGANGCPDPDGDGLRDLEDACPRVWGPPDRWGCPR